MPPRTPRCLFLQTPWVLSRTLVRSCRRTAHDRNIVGAPDVQTLERLLTRLVQRILRRLTRDGLLVEDPEQPWLDLESPDTLDQLNAASIRYRIAVGQGAGGRTLTLDNPALARTNSTPKPFTANRNGFSLNCSVACQAHQRDRLERLCRYITRPPLCLDRLSTNAAGQVVYQLKNPFHDGTTHVLFSPQDFIGRLAALVPRPRINSTRPAAQVFSETVSRSWTFHCPHPGTSRLCFLPPVPPGPSKAVRLSWAQLHSMAQGTYPLEDLGPTDVIYNPGPTYHAGAKVFPYMAALIGGSHVMRPFISATSMSDDHLKFGSPLAGPYSLGLRIQQAPTM